jgi:uncharacterized protein YkwD
MQRVRHLTLPLTTALAVVACVLSLSIGTAAAAPRTAHATRALTHLRAHAAPSRQAAVAGCRLRPREVCQASAKSPHRTTRSHRRTPSTPDAVKSVGVPPLETAGAKVRAAQIAGVLATGCENTQLTPEAGNLGLIRAAVLCLINKVRAQNGESPLRVSARLEQAAEGHSHELVSADYFAHVSPGGKTPVDRVRETGYIPGPSAGYVIGENLAWGTYGLATPASIVSAWIASPGHLANILESQYSETGIGVTPQVPASLGNGAPGATYAQEFGVIVH